MKITDIKTYLMQPQPAIVDGTMLVPDGPGLGVDIDEEAIARYPSQGNISPPQMEEYTYFRARPQRARWLSSDADSVPDDFI